ILGLEEKSKILPSTVGELLSKFTSSNNELHSLLKEYNVSDLEVNIPIEKKLSLLGVEVESISYDDVSTVYDACPIHIKTISLKDGRIVREELCKKKAREIEKRAGFTPGYDFVFAYKPVIEKQ